MLQPRAPASPDHGPATGPNIAPSFLRRLVGRINAFVYGIIDDIAQNYVVAGCRDSLP